MICRSLISWINDGSHYISEDLYVEGNEEVVERYFDVFKKIFYIQDHRAHFNMMMGDYQYETIHIDKNGEADEKVEEQEALVEIKFAMKEVASGSEKK